ncbi:MAG: tetratricopeptide repeat protein [Planctomycetota bacterium]
MATKNRKKRMDNQKKARALRQKKAEAARPLIRFDSPKDVGVPMVDFDRMLRAIADRDPRVWQSFVQYLHHFESCHYVRYGREAVKALNQFVQCFFTALATEGFQPDNQSLVNLIQMNHLTQHVIASTSYQNTDALLDSALSMDMNLPKILMLMNPRCEIQLKQDKLFEADPTLASLWYNAYMLGISSPTKLIQTNIYRHLAQMDERWTPPNHSVSGLYFSSTYHNPDAVRRVKSIMNAGMKRTGRMPEFTNRPSEGDQKHIAIVSNRWHRNHAVYKSASPLVEQLVGKYKLTLIWTAAPDAIPPTIVKDYFDDMLHCYFKPDGTLVVPDEMLSNDYDMVYFPDIGMSDESIWLSNCRIAPVQAVGYGHPDTTGDNNEIDYFVGGDVEKHSTSAYSETMVLLPGLAQEPAWPTAERKFNYKDDGVVRVNCVWGPDKYNFTLLQVLQAINAKVVETNKEPTHEFHLFASPGVNRYAALPSFSREVSKLLPNAVIHSEQEYYDYMENAEMHDFSLNSFPFGCYNVLIESLYMGLPFLSLVGDRFYNRAGMWLNDQIGMSENNFAQPNEFVAKAAELINNPAELRRQRDHLASLDLKDCLFTLKGDHFLEAVEYMLANHPFTETKIIGA